MLGLAMARCQLRALADSCSANLDLWCNRGAEEYGFPGTCASSSSTCGVHASMEGHNSLFAADGLGIPFDAVQGRSTTYGQHAGPGSSAASGSRSGSVNRARFASLRIPQPET